MTEPLIWPFIVICFAPALGIFDWVLFGHLESCEKCGEKMHPFTWIVATFLELLLFALGVYVGVSL